MILTCPACSARYEVAEGTIPAHGRQVKCSSCHHSWRAEAQAVENRPAGTGFRRQTGDANAADPFVRGGVPRRARFHAAVPTPTPTPTPAMGSGSRPVAFAGNTALAYDTQAYDARAYDAMAFEAEPALREQAQPAVEDALSMPAIARLLQQYGEAPQPGDAGAGEGKQGSGGEKTGPLRRVARLVLAGGEALAVRLEGLATRSGGTQSAPQGAAVSRRTHVTPAPGTARQATPGDRKVVEWRLEQLRRMRRRMTPAKAMGWTALWAGLAGTLAAAIFLHREIAAIWPQADAAYEALGVAGGPASPLVVSEAGHRFALSQRGPVVELFGTLSNRGEAPVEMPLIEAAVLDADGAMIAQWAFAPAGLSGEAGARMPAASDLPFRVRALVPDGAASIRLQPMTARTRSDLAGRLPADLAGPAERYEQWNDGSTFFMQKTTSGWGESQSALPARGGEGRADADAR